MSGHELVRALEKAGFTVRRQHGSHIIMRRDDPYARTVVPNHRQIDRGTLRAILRQADVSPEDLSRTTLKRPTSRLQDNAVMTLQLPFVSNAPGAPEPERHLSVSA